MIPYSFADFFRLARGIYTSHNSLKFRELFDHIGSKICFAYFCSPLSVFYQFLFSHAGKYKLYQFFYSSRLIKHGAQILLKTYTLKFRKMCIKRNFSVLMEEKFCIRKTCIKNSFVTQFYQFKSSCVTISDSCEIRQYITVISNNSKIPLMFAHYSNEYLPGKFQIIR